MQKRDDTVMGRPLMLNLLSLGVFIFEAITTDFADFTLIFTASRL